MGSFSIWHWLIVGVVVMLLFGGRGKVSELMGDMAKGIKAFKKGLSEDETTTATHASPPAPEPVRPIEHRGETVAASRAEPMPTSTLADRKLG